MRRMYSEQELTKVIKEVFEAEVADGALDENIANAVDDYLEENPVDITALEGLDIEVKSITATDGIDIDELVGENGEQRFIEGDGTPNSDISGLTSAYCKWSLSGTHLMLVFAGSLASGSVVANSKYLVNFTIPSWIGAKITPVWGGAYLEFKSITLIA